MKAPSLLSRLRAVLKAGIGGAETLFGAPFIGYYRANGSRVSGAVWDPTLSNEHVAQWTLYPPASIVVTKDGETIGVTEQFNRHGRNWQFDLDVGASLAAQDLLQERIRVFAVDRLGYRSTVNMDGAAQLGYVKEAFAPRSETELVVDFSLAGNSREHVVDGWSGPEPDFTWTAGTRSTIAIAFEKPGSRYGLEIRTWPFIVPGKISDQRLDISICGVLIGAFRVNSGENLLECQIPPELAQIGRVIVELYHPEAARPCDVKCSSDARVIAFALEQMKVKRWLEQPN